MSSLLVIKAVVEETEKPAVLLAAEQIEKGLAEAGEPIVATCDFNTRAEDLQSSLATCVVITSLLSEVANYGEPWLDVEKRLRARYCELVKNPSLVIFVLTIFRHVAGFEPERCELMRIRIRRLDLLVAEISREYGVMVIDVDRDIADVGAHKLQTDYRLLGKPAEFLAAKCIALAIISTGLDEYASFAAQDVAKQIIANGNLDLGSIATTEVKPPNILSLGAGRRRQAVRTVVNTDSQSHASWLVDLLLSGQFSIGDAISKLKGSIARRGVRVSAMLLFAAVRESLNGRKKA